MAELTPEITVDDLILPGSFISARDVGDVLIGDEPVGPLIEASSSGDDAVLRRLLSKPQWIKPMLECPPTIYKEKGPREGPDGKRKVKARKIPNVERAFTLAVQNRHAPVLSTLMAFSTRQGVRAFEFVSEITMMPRISNDYAWVWEELAIGDPDIVNFHIFHGARVLYEAVRLRQADVVAVLLKYGADPQGYHRYPEKLGTFNSSLIFRAAMARDPRMTELLLEHGAIIAGTAALHSAAALGRLDAMRILMQYGADVNEVIQGEHGWTPLHWAASRTQVDAMKLLEQCGARGDLKDYKDRTPAQLLEVIISMEQSKAS